MGVPIKDFKKRMWSNFCPRNSTLLIVWKQAIEGCEQKQRHHWNNERNELRTYTWEESEVESSQPE